MILHQRICICRYHSQCRIRKPIIYFLGWALERNHKNKISRGFVRFELRIIGNILLAYFVPIYLDLSIGERDIFWLRLLRFGPKDCQKDFQCSAYSKYFSLHGFGPRAGDFLILVYDCSDLTLSCLTLSSSNHWAKELRFNSAEILCGCVFSV